MMRIAARWMSILLHPLFMPVYTLVIAFRLDFNLSFFLPAVVLWVTLGMVFVMTVLFPLTSVLMLLRGGIVETLEMRRPQERIAPYVMTLFYYTLAYWLLRKTEQHEATYAMLFGAIAAVGLTTLITLRWKISAHMVGIGGLLGALAGLFLLHGTFGIEVLAIGVVIAGALGTARLVDSDHDPAQVYCGALLGFVVMFLCVSGPWSL